MLPRIEAAVAVLLTAASMLASPPPARRTTPHSAAAAARADRPDAISLDLKDADVRDVLRTFAELEHFNLVIDPEVRGSVTVRLENVRWEDALDVILRCNGLGRVLVGNVVRAAPTGKLVGAP